MPRKKPHLYHVVFPDGSMSEPLSWQDAVAKAYRWHSVMEGDAYIFRTDVIESQGKA